MADEKINEKKDMMEEALKYIDRVLSQINDVCRNIREKEGIEVIPQISEGLIALVQIAAYTKDITGIKIDMENISGFVSEMTEGMENSDYTLTADIIEYEIKPLYEEWGEAFSRGLKND